MYWTGVIVAFIIGIGKLIHSIWTQREEVKKLEDDKIMTARLLYGCSFWFIVLISFTSWLYVFFIVFYMASGLIIGKKSE